MDKSRNDERNTTKKKFCYPRKSHFLKRANRNAKLEGQNLGEMEKKKVNVAK